MIPIDLGGCRLQLHPSGAAFEPQGGRLLVADLHLGKGTTLRSAGVPIPGGTSRETMERVSAAIEAIGPERVAEVWVLGDLVHARAGLSAELVGAVARWVDSLPGARLHLVAGNHDRGAGTLPENWALALHEEPHTLRAGEASLVLAHEPRTETGAPAHVAGHLHPMVRIGRGRTRTGKVPAFMARESRGVGVYDLLVLPALGSLVDGAVVRERPGWSAWACAGGAVAPVPRGSW